MLGGRIVSTNEENFLICVKHNLWGAKRNILKGWQIGEKIIFRVDKNIAAYGEVISKSYYDKRKVWRDDLYPYRIRIKVEHILPRDKRFPLSEEIKKRLIHYFGDLSSYRFGLINQKSIPIEIVSFIINKMLEIPHYPSFLEKLDSQIRETKESKDAPTVSLIREHEDNTEDILEEEIKHAELQYYIIKLGHLANCRVWVARNDRSKIFQETKFGDITLEALPKNIGFDRVVMSTIELIDVIWLRNNMPIAAFEIEKSSSIYSGLLRLSDLVTLIPTIKIKLYIVAEISRREKVIAQVNRPTFRNIGLSEYCKFIPAERLKKLVFKIGEIGKYVKVDIIDSIAEILEIDRRAP